jgi:hypothetical protein
MRSLVLAAALFAGLAGCSTNPAPATATSPAATTSSSAQALVSTPSSLTLDRGQHGACPLQWTCDYVHYYSTKTACLASDCGASCMRDYNCNGNCVCP